MAADRLKALELRLIDDLFEMGDGYVLDFSNRTFAEFFADELNINIDDNRWRVDGDSKAKRLRYFLRSNSPPIVIRILVALWNYRETNRKLVSARTSFTEISARTSLTRRCHSRLTQSMAYTEVF